MTVPAEIPLIEYQGNGSITIFAWDWKMIEDSFILVLVDNIYVGGWSLEGKTVVFEVTPVAVEGASPGTAVQSAGVVITANIVPTATDVNITGTPEVGETLTGNYTYSDVDSDVELASTFEWLSDGVLIAGASTQTYVVVQSDKNTAISFRVTPAAETGASPGIAVESATLTIQNVAPIANDDSFDVPEGGSPVAGSNVLTNDTDPDEVPAILTAELVAGPALDPAFVLNSDGTFSYTHDDSETLSDSFTYIACDNDATPLCSPAATVTINVDRGNGDKSAQAIRMRNDKWHGESTAHRW